MSMAQFLFHNLCPPRLLRSIYSQYLIPTDYSYFIWICIKCNPWIPEDTRNHRDLDKHTEVGGIKRRSELSVRKLATGN